MPATSSTTLLADLRFLNILASYDAASINYFPALSIGSIQILDEIQAKKASGIIPVVPETPTPPPPPPLQSHDAAAANAHAYANPYSSAAAAAAAAASSLASPPLVRRCRLTLSKPSSTRMYPSA